jgi:hypothetical protein
LWERREVRDMKTKAHEVEMRELSWDDESSRPLVEIWPDPFYDEWAEWVRSHERKRMGYPLDLCEIVPGFRGSPLCPLGIH